MNPANTSTALAVSGNNPSTYGESLTLNATVTNTSNATFTPSAGTVTFLLNGSTVLGMSNLMKNGTAKLVTTAVGTGSNQTITATYNGTTNFATSTSTAATQTVNTASTSTTVAAVAGNPSSPTYGQTLTFTATVTDTSDPSVIITNGNGTVTFYDGSVNLGSVPVWGGIATLPTGQVSAGTNSITAVYNGYSTNGMVNFAASPTSPAITQTVGTANTSVTLVAAPGNPNPSTYGVPLTFTATVTDTSPGGSNVIPQIGIVTLYNNGTEVTALAISKGTASFTFPYAPYYYPALAVSGSPYSFTAIYTDPNNANGVPDFNTSNSNSRRLPDGNGGLHQHNCNPGCFRPRRWSTGTITVTISQHAPRLGGYSRWDGDLQDGHKRSSAR